MSLCASCGLPLSSDAGICPHHHAVYGDEWAASNRVHCDFFHRGIVPERLPEADRDIQTDNYVPAPDPGMF